MPEDWIAALDEAKVKDNWINVAYPNGISILLIKKDGSIYALRNRCQHMSCTLAGGKLEGFVLQCPCHDWRYDIRTGQFLDASEFKLPIYETKSEGGKIYVRM